MHKLIQTICTFLEKEPERRYEELTTIAQYAEIEQMMGALAIIFPSCTDEEKIVLSQQLGREELEGDFAFPVSIVHMFFKDASIEAGPEALSSLCCAALKSASPEIRKNMLTSIEDGFVPVTDSISKELVLMLGDPEEKVRQNAAEILSSITVSENPLELHTEQIFSSAFYLGDIRAGKHLAEMILEQENAAAFLFLCFTQSGFGPLKHGKQNFPKKLIAALYSSSKESKVDFQEAVSEAIGAYCRQRKRFSSMAPNEETVLKRGIREFVKSSKKLVDSAARKTKKRLKTPRQSSPPKTRNPNQIRH